MVTATERHMWNALKFGQSREVNMKERRALSEGLDLAPQNCSEVEAPQVELNGAVGESLITNPPPQRLRTKLLFDVIIDNQFFD